MVEKRTIIVGDVHGCLDELLLLLKKCQYQPDHDRLILIGDVVNKGPQSVETLQWIRQNKVEVIKGNHELRLLQVLRESLHQLPKRSISDVIVDMQKLLGDEFDKYVEWIVSWPNYIEEEDFIAVHAGLVPNKKPEDTDVAILATIRTWDGKGEKLNRKSDPAWHDLYHGTKVVVYGHWAMQGLKVKPNSIGLDSGCVYGRQLSAVILPERRIVQVQAAQVYNDGLED